MKVKDAIKLLQSYNQDADVYLHFGELFTQSFGKTYQEISKNLCIRYVIASSYVDCEHHRRLKCYDTPFGKRILVRNDECGFIHADSKDTVLMFKTRKEARGFYRSDTEKVYKVIINTEGEVVQWLKENP